jgi:hypothetical protein
MHQANLTKKNQPKLWTLSKWNYKLNQVKYFCLKSK